MPGNFRLAKLQTAFLPTTHFALQDFVFAIVNDVAACGLQKAVQVQRAIKLTYFGAQVSCSHLPLGSFFAYVFPSRSVPEAAQCMGRTCVAAFCSVTAACKPSHCELLFSLATVSTWQCIHHLPPPPPPHRKIGSTMWLTQFRHGGTHGAPVFRQAGQSRLVCRLMLLTKCLFQPQALLSHGLQPLCCTGTGATPTSEAA